MHLYKKGSFSSKDKSDLTAYYWGLFGQPEEMIRENPFAIDTEHVDCYLCTHTGHIINRV